MYFSCSKLMLLRCTLRCPGSLSGGWGTFGGLGVGGLEHELGPAVDPDFLFSHGFVQGDGSLAKDGLLHFADGQGLFLKGVHLAGQLMAP